MLSSALAEMNFLNGRGEGGVVPTFFKNSVGTLWSLACGTLQEEDLSGLGRLNNP